MKKATLTYLSLIVLIFISINSGNAFNSFSGKFVSKPIDIDSMKSGVDAVVKCPPPDTPCTHDIAGGDTVALDNQIAAVESLMDGLEDEKENIINNLDSIETQMLLSKRQIDSSTSFGIAVSPSAFNTYHNFKLGRKNEMTKMRQIDLLIQKLDYYLTKLTFYNSFK